MNKYCASAKIILLLLLSFSLSSCGMIRENFGRKNTNTLIINVTPPNNMSAMAWPNVFQIMVYIVGTSGTNFSVAVPINVAGTATATGYAAVPNGLYSGYAVAWDGVAGTLSGQVGCWQDATANSIEGGGTKNININMSTTNTNVCDYGSGVFTDAAHNQAGSNFALISVNTCASGATAAACGIASTTYVTGSIRIKMDGYMQDGGPKIFSPGNFLNSACTAITTNLATTSSAIPVGSTNPAKQKFLSTTIEFFPAGNSTCSGAPGRVVNFPNGLANGASDTTSGLGTGNPSNLYVDLGS